MESMTCPQCNGEMQPVQRGGVTIAKCGSCAGVYLDRTTLGTLIEKETEWHLSSGPRTEPLPRITSDMQAPPPHAGSVRARSYIDELFA